MHPQGAADAIGDQVSGSVISAEMCQSDKTDKGRGGGGGGSVETDSAPLLKDKIRH